MSAKKNLKRTYFPKKTFDDDLDAFGQLASSAGWNFSGVDIVQLVQDAADQRTERARHDAAQLEFDRLHEEFGLAQEARHARFSDALNAARGAFRRDKTILAQLDRFSRSTTHSAAPAEEAEDKE